ncbi:MAG: SH3 domain-containing protein [Aliarcobacter sp.]|nr:SH3 domain-containing protein [Aliarcobacter sp.]
MNNLDNKISKSLKQELHYEVTKQVNIRELADTKSKKIAVVYPKQKLLVIENKPYWLQVEYFDEKRNETIIGWVSKKCTKRLN